MTNKTQKYVILAQNGCFVLFSMSIQPPKPVELGNMKSVRHLFHEQTDKKTVLTIPETTQGVYHLVKVVILAISRLPSCGSKIEPPEISMTFGLS